jgi:hypothetical protein
MTQNVHGFPGFPGMTVYCQGMGAATVVYKIVVVDMLAEELKLEWQWEFG